MTILRIGLCTLLAVASCAQNPRLEGAEFFAALNRARELNRAKELEKAAPIYKRLLEASPLDTSLWREYGLLQSQIKDYKGAAISFDRAYTLGTTFPASAALSVARMHARAGDKERAYDWLEKTLAVPYEARPSLATDAAFESIAQEDRFRKLAGLLTKQEFGRESGWRFDIDYFLAEVKRMHYAAWKYHTLPDGFEADIAKLKQRVPQLTDVEIRVELQRLIAKLGDGHTRMNLASVDGLRQIPHTFYVFADGLYVTGAPEDCRCIGAKITSIEGVDWRDVLHKLEAYASHENEMGFVQSVPNLARIPGLLKAIGISRNGDSLTFEIERTGGAKQTVVAKPEASTGMRGSLPVPPGRPVPLYLDKAGTNYWFTPLPDGKTMYFKFAQVQHQPQGETIDEFAKRIGKALKDGGFENIVVDVRLNGGGNLGLMTPLIRTLIQFEMSRENAKIYVITGRQTYSAAQVFINELDHWASPIFAGEPSSSRPNFIGESAPFRLPYSGVTGTISTRYHPTDTMDDRPLIPPRIPVVMTSSDYFAGRDPVLEAVMTVIKSGR